MFRWKLELANLHNQPCRQIHTFYVRGVDLVDKETCKIPSCLQGTHAQQVRQTQRAMRWRACGERTHWVRKFPRPIPEFPRCFPAGTNYFTIIENSEKYNRKFLAAAKLNRFSCGIVLCCCSLLSLLRSHQWHPLPVLTNPIFMAFLWD